MQRNHCSAAVAAGVLADILAAASAGRMLLGMCRLENILIAVEEKMAGSQSAVAVEAAGGIPVVTAGEEMADSQSAVAVETGGRLAVVAGGS